MSSFNILDEVKALEESLKCKICKSLLLDPLLIVKCGHTTCKSCFSKHVDMSCPVCDIPVTTKDSLEDKQLKEVLVHLHQLKNLFQNEQEGSDQGTSDDKMEKENTPNIQKKVLSCNAPKAINQLSSKDALPKTPTVPLNRRAKPTANKRTSTPKTNISTPSPTGNINKKNHKGETLLQRAVIKGDKDKVLALLNEGALVNTQDNNGWTPLHEASNKGFVEIAEILIENGALVNVPSLKDNITPLHDALINDQMAMAILLVSRGADLHVKTSFGYTALQLCKTDGDRNILVEACSPFINANTIIPETKVSPVKSEKIVFLASKLEDKQKDQLQKCAQMLKADIVDDFKPDVTHIVTSCDDTGNCTRTLKILLGILAGKWIMNYQWIDVCLEYKQKIEEEVFEVQGTNNQPNLLGPKKGRLNCEQKFPPLFDGFYFYLHGSFTNPTPSREDLCNLIHLGGGKILSREPRPESVATEPYLIPYHAAGTPFENTSHVILYQDKPPRDTHVNSGHICTSQVMWLITCIGEYKLLEPLQKKIGNK